MLAADDTQSMLIALALFLIVLACGLCVALLTKRFKRCPSNKLLVVFGLGAKGTAEVLHGGAKLVWPWLQDYAYMSLEPLVVEFPETGIFTRESVRARLSGSVTIAISTKSALMHKAAERLLGLDARSIQSLGQDETAAALRELVANLNIEMIFRDRERFGAELQHALEFRLEKYGLEVLNVRVGDVGDEAGVIEGFEREAAGRARQRNREDAEFQARRERELAALAEKQRRQEEVQVQSEDRDRDARRKGATPASDVLTDDPGDALKKM